MQMSVIHVTLHYSYPVVEGLKEEKKLVNIH
jgi:hypothetical protein